MPELPEVECITRNLSKIVEGKKLTKIKFYRSDLRFPIGVEDWHCLFQGQTIEKVFRRSKYILWQSKSATGLIHLGMTGNLLQRPHAKPHWSHTHVVFTFSNQNAKIYLHYVDPRRFGIMQAFSGTDISEHKLIKNLGPEPLSCPLLGKYLHTKAYGKTQPIKNLLMDAKVIVGVGNIYANEALFRAGIHPLVAAGDVSLLRYKRLANSVRTTLKAAIKQGGTSFRDFRSTEGKPGYFQVHLNVYNRAGKECRHCRHPIKTTRIGGRSTYFCDNCQN